MPNISIRCDRNQNKSYYTTISRSPTQYTEKDNGLHKLYATMPYLCTVRNMIYVANIPYPQFDFAYSQVRKLFEEQTNTEINVKWSIKTFSGND